jgi:hypothetical protein
MRLIGSRSDTTPQGGVAWPLASQGAGWPRRRLRPATRAAGLSPRDRACLALVAALGVRAVTADRSWQSVAEAGVR